MAARQRTDFSPVVGGLFLQLDMLSQLEAKDELRMLSAEVEGYNPSWAEPVIRRNYSHRHISDRPTLRLALHGLRQSLDDLKDPGSPDFSEALDWVNHADCPMQFSWVCALLEINPRDARMAIIAIHPGLFIAAGSLDLLRLRSATPAAPLTTKDAARNNFPDLIKIGRCPIGFRRIRRGYIKSSNEHTDGFTGRTLRYR